MLLVDGKKISSRSAKGNSKSVIFLQYLANGLFILIVLCEGVLFENLGNDLSNHPIV